MRPGQGGQQKRQQSSLTDRPFMAGTGPAPGQGRGRGAPRRGQRAARLAGRTPQSG